MLFCLSSFTAQILGLMLALIFFILINILLQKIRETRHEQWLRLCHKCGNRKNTYKDSEHMIGFWCNVHGNYLVEKASFRG